MIKFIRLIMLTAVCAIHLKLPNCGKSVKKRDITNFSFEDKVQAIVHKLYCLPTSPDFEVPIVSSSLREYSIESSLRIDRFLSGSYSTPLPILNEFTLVTDDIPARIRLSRMSARALSRAHPTTPNTRAVAHRWRN